MSGSPEKLVFQGQDFKFMAAYSQYSTKFDKASTDEEKESLNHAISSLHRGEISYEEFYNLINKGQVEKRFHRSQITTSRKFEYRRKEQKQDRLKRHK